MCFLFCWEWGKKTLERRPFVIFLSFIRGWLCIALNSMYRLALDKDPEYVRALVLMGRVLLLKNVNGEAKEYFERAISKVWIEACLHIVFNLLYWFYLLHVKYFVRPWTMMFHIALFSFLLLPEILVSYH